MKRKIFTALLSFTFAAGIMLAPGLTARAGVGYDLKIDGVQVTDANYSDILGNGVFSYDTAYKRLYIRGDYSSASGNSMIESAVYGLDI